MFNQYCEQIKQTIEQITGDGVAVYTEDDFKTAFPKKKTKAELHRELIMAVTDENSLQSFLSDSIPYPVIILEFEKSYIFDKNTYCCVSEDDSEHIENADFISLIPGQVKSKVSLFSDSIDGLIEAEENITNAFNEAIYLTTEKSESINKKVKFSLESDKESSIERKNIGNENKDRLTKNLYSTELFLIADSCVFEIKEYHPTKAELDRSVQIEIINVSFSSMAYANGISEEQPEKSKDIEMAISEYVKPLVDRNSEMRFYSSPLSVKVDMLRLYKQKLEESDCNLFQIEEKFSDDFGEFLKKYEEKEKEKENQENEARRKEKFLQSPGDEMINRYTNAVIDYFKNLIKDDSICYYDGTSYEKLARVLSDKENEYPNIIVYSNYDYSYEDRTFYNIDKNNNEVAYGFNAYAMPIRLRFGVIINCEDVERITQIINSVSKDGLTIYLPDIYYPEQRNQIKLSSKELTKSDEFAMWCNSNYSKEMKFSDVEDVRRCKEEFYNSHKVFFFESTTANAYIHKKYSSEELDYNHDLQLNLLRELEYLTIIHSKLTKDAMKQLEGDYKGLVQPNGSFGSMLLGLLDTAEYKSLKSDFQCRRPIDRNKFNSVLKKITEVYPFLYEKMMQGWTVEQIKQDIESIANQYKEHMEELYELLNIPERIKLIGIKTEYLGRALVAIQNYIKKMNADDCTTISIARSLYETDLYKLEIQKQEERRARAEAAQYEQQYSHESSGGGGIIESTVGSFIGTSGIRKEEKKQTKIMQEQLKLEKERFEEEKRRADRERREAAHRSQVEWDNVRRANEERRRKGQPELPYPKREWW